MSRPEAPTLPGDRAASEPDRTPPPKVSVILPTYNRAGFLPDAFGAIRDQDCDDWELIVVDDGSSDGTREVVSGLAREFPRPVRYIYQENRGAYGARNTGLDHARGRFIAFYDSDDLWLPHHLADCVAAMEADPSLDWVYGSCRMVDHSTGETLAPSTFYEEGRPRPFLRLRTRAVGALRVIDDPDVNRVMIEHGLYSGLQNSVIRRRIFEADRFRVRPRHEAEDQIHVMRALAAGARIAYFDRVHVIYQVHSGHSSAAGGGPLGKLLEIHQQMVLGLEELGREAELGGRERRALRRRLSREYFWHLGYSLHWQRGDRREALAMFRRGLLAWPLDLRCWKTYAVALARTALRPRESSPDLLEVDGGRSR